MASSGSFAGALSDIGKLAELRKRLFFVLFGIFVYRIGTHIPVPGINPLVMADLFQQGQGTILDMFNMFSGGALERFSILSLGIMPYITASIIFTLMTHAVPALEQMRKEGGEAGRRKITQYTRYATVALATFQGVGVSTALMGQNSGGMGLVLDPGIGFVFIATISLVTGSVFAMWLGEQISERGIGNGISILIFIGIVAGLPSAIGGTLENVNTGEYSGIMVLALMIMAILVIGFVVFVERGQRRITVNYAKRQQGRKVFAAQSSHLPLKLNVAGVLPPIFASSIILFPATVGRWFGSSEGMEWLSDIAVLMSPGQPLYVFMYAVAIIFFCFFSAALLFNSRETAQNLKRSGAFIPGVRPGEQTSRYIDNVMTKLTAVGALYITAVCLLPEFLILWMSVPFYFGGTSLLIIVVVVMDFIAQVQSHMVSHQYESLMKKANLKGGMGAGLLR
ncbi:MAG: preprotein translocase subunit SecY [Gammaproteobacteria bacterium]|nr:MAG: preprotein translocase subunit SecY [Gammaproteobacteria bacterium]